MSDVSRILVLEGYSAHPYSHTAKRHKGGTMAKKKRRKSRGGAAQRRKFAAAARACKGQGKRAFQACMRAKLKK